VPGNMPYVVRAYCKFGLSYHSTPEITLNTKVIVFKSMVCQLTHQVRNRTAKIDVNFVIILTKQMHI
jgi:hypothetical protein